MGELRVKIQKTAKALYVICRIAQIGIIISVVAFIGMVIYAFIDPSFTEQVMDVLTSEDIIGGLIDFDFSGLVDEKVLLVLGATIRVISRIILVVYLLIFSKMLNGISKGDQPFTEKNAKTIFWVSLSLLIITISNPIIAIFIFLVGMFLSQLIRYGSYLNQKAEETNRIQENMIVSFAEVVENKSEQTGKHVKRVAEYSYAIAKGMGFSEEDAEKIKLASMMHDIGKLLIPSEILEKPARLSDEEFNEIKKHPGYGVKLLNTVEGDVLILAKKIAHEHHERVDGKGYPEGSNGGNISIEGKIVSVADVYDALTSKRSYKEAWEEDKAFNEILKGKGTQFDANVVDAFEKCHNDLLVIKEKFAD